jgi:hypothetical protein
MSIPTSGPRTLDAPPSRVTLALKGRAPLEALFLGHVLDRALEPERKLSHFAQTLTWAES